MKIYFNLFYTWKSSTALSVKTLISLKLLIYINAVRLNVLIVVYFYSMCAYCGNVGTGKLNALEILTIALMHIHIMIFDDETW